MFDRLAESADALALATFCSTFESDNPPAHWVEGTLGDLTRWEEGRKFAPVEMDGIPWYESGYTRHGRITFSNWSDAGDAHVKVCPVVEDSFLVARMEPFKAAIAYRDGVYNPDTLLNLHLRRPIYSELVKGVLTSHRFSEQMYDWAHGTTRPRIDWRLVQRHPVLVPPDEDLTRYNRIATLYNISKESAFSRIQWQRHTQGKP